MKRILVLTLSAALLIPSSSANAQSTTPTGPVVDCSHAKAALAAATVYRMSARSQAEQSTTDVIHYDIEVSIDPTTRWIEGTTTIRAWSRENDLATFSVRLHPNLAIEAVMVDGTEATWERVGEDGRVEITLPHRLDEGDTFTVAVTYHGFPPTSGFGETGIYFDWRAGSPLVYTLSEPWLAYTWWAVKEDNTDKATAEIVVTVPSTLTVVANGLLDSTQDANGGRTRFRWVTSYPIAPYLIAFAAAPYRTFEETFPFTGGETPVQFFILPSSDTPLNREGWLRSLDMLSTFSSLYGLYPFAQEKYAIYEFGFPGGMEHQTATGQAGFSESLTAHELAHQWWGDMITCASWHDIWLNEGFATYSEALWYEFRNGEDDREMLHSVMQAYRPNNLSQTVYVDDTSDVGRIFSADSSYKKGAWVLHMLRGVVGDAVFFDILHEYRHRYAYRSATTADFQSVAESVWGGDLSWFFDQWVYGSGGPIYRWGRREHEIAGRRFLELSLRQVQGGTPFIMPVQLLTEDGGATHTVTLWNQAEVQHYMVPLEGSAQRVELDPQGWILSRGKAEEPFVSGPPKIVATDPMPGTPLDPDRPIVSLAFQEDVTISDEDLELVRVFSGEAVPVTVSYDPASLTAAVSAGRPLSPGLYRLTVADTVRNPASGMALDGEAGLGAMLPTGDGLPGGTALLFFPVTVQLPVTAVSLSETAASFVTGSEAVTP